MMDSSCMCGSGKDYKSCCGLCHQGTPAATPEGLMRSRYVAFVLRLTDYLQQTWHPSTRPVQLDLKDSPDWAALQVIDSSERGNQGQVHFRAIYRAGSGWGYLEEQSDFVRESGRWYYLTGTTREGELKPGRNEACPCGSGRKFKVCCK